MVDCLAMAYPSDLSDEQWAILQPLLVGLPKRGPRFGGDLRVVVNALRYIAHTGCQWRYLPSEYGKWTRAWSQFRRWSMNGTWERVVATLHEQARSAAGRSETHPSMVVIDTHLARGAALGGPAFHDRGGPYGATNGAKRVVAVDVTGMPVAGVVVPASTGEAETVDLLLGQMADAGQTERLELVIVDRGTSVSAAKRIGRKHGCEVRRVFWDEPPTDGTGKRIFKPIRHAWQVEVAHGRLGRRRRLARSFEKTTWSGSGWLAVACVMMILGEITGQET